MYRSLIKRPTAVALALLVAACSMKSISHRSELATQSSLSLQQLQDTDYDVTQVIIEASDAANKAAAVRQDLPKGQGEINQTLKPGSYHIDLHYLKAGSKVLSTDFCSAADKKSQDVQLVFGPNKVRIIVCSQDGKPVQDADVAIIPIKKAAPGAPPAQAPGITPPQDAAVSRGAAIYGTQCSGCHGLKGEIVLQTGHSLQGSKCASCSSQDSLAAKIAASMPIGGAPLCKDACASDVATYILKNLH